MKYYPIFFLFFNLLNLKNSVLVSCKKALPTKRVSEDCLPTKVVHCKNITDHWKSVKQIIVHKSGLEHNFVHKSGLEHNFVHKSGLEHNFVHKSGLEHNFVHKSGLIHLRNESIDTKNFPSFTDDKNRVIDDKFDFEFFLRLSLINMKLKKVVQGNFNQSK